MLEMRGRIKSYIVNNVQLERAGLNAKIKAFQKGSKKQKGQVVLLNMQNEELKGKLHRREMA